MWGFSYKMNVGRLTKLHRLVSYRNISPTMFTNNLNLKKVLSLYSEVVNINKISKPIPVKMYLPDICPNRRYDGNNVKKGILKDYSKSFFL